MSTCTLIIPSAHELQSCQAVVTAKIARSRDLGIRATHKQKESVKNWLHYASNRLVRVINSASLLVTPIDGIVYI